MLINFVEEQLKKARYKLLEDQTYFGEIPGLDGVWANNKTLEGCRAELAEVLEEWCLLKIRNGDDIPGLELAFAQRVSMNQYDQENYA